MSLSLKHIPCPAGAKCTAFKCIFGHPGEGDTPEPSPAENNGNVHNAEAVSADQGTPRKRPRLDPFVSPATNDAKATRNKEKHKVQSEIHSPNKNKNNNKNNNKNDIQTVARPVSPPPLKRVANVGPSFASSTQKRGPEPVSRRPKTETASAKGKTGQCEKSETLIPRHLGGAPATHAVRTKLLKLLHEQFSRLNRELKNDASDEEAKLAMSDQELITLALDREQQTAQQKPTIYSNVMKNAVMQYKRMGAQQWVEERRKHTNIKTTTAQLDEIKKIATGLSTEKEVQLLHRLLTSIEGLSAHGYVPAVPSDEAIQKARDGLQAAQGWENCDRCAQRFQVFPGRREDGALTSGGTCIFHPGKALIPQKPPGDKTRRPKQYSCCGEQVGDSAGCGTRDYHVFKVGSVNRLATVLNFAETPPNEAPTDRAVCFDCEMAYTVHGMELVRLTATSWPTGEQLLDVLVHPIGEILDLNSRYSGVFAEDMAQAKLWMPGDDLKPPPSMESGSEDGELRSSKKDIKIVSSPKVARDLLFSLISPTTPLIGHALENDLNAVRIVHPTLIDTVLLYPTARGLPMRNGLKALMMQHLGRRIQLDTGSGHDSAEDARAAGELVRLKVMNKWKDMQREGWRVVDDEFVPPGPKHTQGQLS